MNQGGVQVLELPRLAGSTATGEEVAEKLRTHGAVIVENLVDPNSVMETLRSDLEQASGTFYGAEGSFAGAHTTRNAAKPLGESRVAQVLAEHPLVLKACELRLKPWCRRFVLGTCSNINVEPPPDADTPPAASQVLHRDEGMWAASEWPWLPTTTDDRPEFSVSVMWAVSDFTVDNGATRMLPGSHRWPRGGGGGGGGGSEYDTEDPKALEQLEAKCVQATMPKGSVVLWSGATLHGQTAHRPFACQQQQQSKEQLTRRGLLFIYNVGWVKSEHNWHWAMPHEVIMKMPESLRELIGMVGGNRIQHDWYTGPVYAQPILGSAEEDDDEINAFNGTGNYDEETSTATSGGTNKKKGYSSVLTDVFNAPAAAVGRI